MVMNIEFFQEIKDKPLNELIEMQGNRAKFNMNKRYSIDTAIKLKEHEDTSKQIRSANIRAWISIVISFISTVIALTAIFSK